MALRTYKSQSIEAVSVAGCLQLHSQLVDLGILFGGCVSRVTALWVWGCCWVVVMVILGIEFHGGVFRSHDEGKGTILVRDIVCSKTAQGGPGQKCLFGP